MIKVISLVLVGIICLFQESRANELRWNTPEAKLRSVYTPTKKSKNIELIRLYNNNTFEHLIYTPAPEKGIKSEFNEGHRSTVECNRGTYSLASGKLKMSCTSEEFDTDFYNHDLFIAGHAYESKRDSKLRNKEFVLTWGLVMDNSQKENPPYFDSIAKLNNTFFNRLL